MIGYRFLRPVKPHINRAGVVWTMPIPWYASRISTSAATIRRFSSDSRTARIRIVAIGSVSELDNLSRLRTFLDTLTDPKPSAVVCTGGFLTQHDAISSVDLGKNAVETIKAVGISHMTLGTNDHEFRLSTLRKRLTELTTTDSSSESLTDFTSSSALRSPNTNVRILNTNLQRNLQHSGAEWIDALTQPYSIITSSCKRVQVALLGLLTDESHVFRDGTYRGIPISNILDSYSTIQSELCHPQDSTSVLHDKDHHQQPQDPSLVNPTVNLCIPLSNASAQRDRELALSMLQHAHQPSDSNTVSIQGVILGSHDQAPLDELVVTSNQGSIRVAKCSLEGADAAQIDLIFQLCATDTSSEGTAIQPQLTSVEYSLVNLKDYEPNAEVQNIVQRHQATLLAMEKEPVMDMECTLVLPLGTLLSSERTRFQQTTIGSLFCSMIKEELQVDAAILHGTAIQGNTTYPDLTLTYADLKRELPFPTQMVVVPMERYILDEALWYSRSAFSSEQEDQEEKAQNLETSCLQIDCEYDALRGSAALPDDIVRVALPQNLLNGFCNIKPLMRVGEALRAKGAYPGPNDSYAAIDLLIRNACKNRWTRILAEEQVFEKFDRDGNGVLDRDELQQMLAHYLRHIPSDFVVSDMLAAIDNDGNGVIDQGEFSFLRAAIEQERGRLG